MSLAFRSVKNIAEHFTCPVHLGKLKDPRMLPCEHSFCTECLNDVIKTAISARFDCMFECPVCRAKHNVPESDSDDWAKGFPIDAFSVLQLHTLSQFEQSQMCEKHVQKFKEYFCFYHKEILCPDCVIEFHAKSPCSCGSVQDSVIEVRLQMKELVGQLRQQENRAKMIMDTKMDNPHAEDLVRKITEMERQLNRFCKGMKAKLQQAKQEIAESSKISHAEKEHLSTVRSVISKTKKHVEEILRSKHSKTAEGANEILTVWPPLEAEVDHFNAALEAVETRPFAIEVQFDEQFARFISYDKVPLVVRQGVESPRPVNFSFPKSPIESNPKHVSYAGMHKKPPTPKSMRRTISLTSPTRTSNLRSSFLHANRPSTEEKTFPLIQSPQSPHMPSISSSKSPSRATSILKPSIQSLTALPRVITGDYITRDTSRSFNVSDFKLKTIKQVSSFELPTGDLVILDNHIVTITETAIQKYDLEYQYLEGVPIRNPWRLCVMRDTTNVCVNHNTGRFLSICATSPVLNIMYRIETQKPYSEICHMRTTIVEDRFGRVNYFEHFALTHTTDLRADCIDLIKVTYDHNPFTHFTPKTTKLIPSSVKTLIASDSNSIIRGPNAMVSTSDGKRIIVGAESSVICINQKGDVIWSRPVAKFVSSVSIEKGLVFVCIENERKLMILDEAGNHMQENIFPLGSSIMRPNKVSVERNSMIVREFNESDWKSFVHIFALTFV